MVTYGDIVINMFCSQCGSKNDEEAKFCKDCGEPVKILSTDSKPAKSSDANSTRTEAIKTSYTRTKPDGLFAGRMLRREYAVLWIIYMAVIFAAMSVFSYPQVDLEIGDLVLAVLIPFMATYMYCILIPGSVRRLHDVGSSGWWILLFLMFPISLFALLVWPPIKTTSKYGKDVSTRPFKLLTILFGENITMYRLAVIFFLFLFFWFLILRVS